MRVHTEQDFPQPWATTQNNLGNAWAQLPAGDRSANLRQAIDCYQAALRVRTEQDFPQGHETTIQNLQFAREALDQLVKREPGASQ